MISDSMRCNGMGIKAETETGSNKNTNIKNNLWKPCSIKGNKDK